MGLAKFHKDNMPENINGGNFLSHPYLSTHRLSKRHESIPAALFQRQISIYRFHLDRGVIQTIFHKDSIKKKQESHSDYVKIE